MPEVVVPLTIRDLTAEDLPSCPWLARAPYLASVAQGLECARRGEADYLAVCPPSGLPVALGGIIYSQTPGTGRLRHLEVHAALHSCGIGTLLIQAAEQRIRARSWDTEGAAGFRTRYETVCTLMRKQLP